MPEYEQRFIETLNSATRKDLHPCNSQTPLKAQLRHTQLLALPPFTPVQWICHEFAEVCFEYTTMKRFCDSLRGSLFSRRVASFLTSIG